jgi:hypothetical protein
VSPSTPLRSNERRVALRERLLPLREEREALSRAERSGQTCGALRYFCGALRSPSAALREALRKAPFDGAERSARFSERSALFAERSPPRSGTIQSTTAAFRSCTARLRVRVATTRIASGAPGMPCAQVRDHSSRCVRSQRGRAHFARPRAFGAVTPAHLARGNVPPRDVSSRAESRPSSFCRGGAPTCGG